MEKITELLDKLQDIGKLIPKMDKMVEWAQWLISFSVRIGPLCILFLGVIYLLIPPKEANRKAGFRTYFGMGSVEAWLFTQRVAGTIMTVSGLILHFIAKGASKKFASMATLDMAEKAFEIIRVQIIWILVIYAFMFVLTAVMFNRNGINRFANILPERPLQVKKELPKREKKELPKQEKKEPPKREKKEPPKREKKELPKREKKEPPKQEKKEPPKREKKEFPKWEMKEFPKWEMKEFPKWAKTDFSKWGKKDLPKQEAEIVSEADYWEQVPERKKYERQGEQVITADDIVIEGLE